MSFQTDLEFGQNAERKLAKKLSAAPSPILDYDLILPNLDSVEVKTEKYSWGTNVYIEFCDVNDGEVAPTSPKKALSGFKLTGPFRSEGYGVKWWIHGMKLNDNLAYVWFDVTELCEHLRHNPPKRWTGKGVRNKKWTTYGCAIPQGQLLKIARRVTLI